MCFRFFLSSHPRHSTRAFNDYLHSVVYLSLFNLIFGYFFTKPRILHRSPTPFPLIHIRQYYLLFAFEFNTKNWHCLIMLAHLKFRLIKVEFFFYSFYSVFFKNSLCSSFFSLIFLLYIMNFFLINSFCFPKLKFFSRFP